MKDNKLIAEFMGVKPLHMGESVEYEIYGILDFIEDGIDEQHFFLEEELKFHSSWDWLMPVAEKCLCTDEKTDGQHYFINDALLTCNIEVVFDRVVEFIKDYNKSIKN